MMQGAFQGVWQIKPSQAIGVFSDGQVGSTMETVSDLSAWTTTVVTDGGCSIAVDTAQYHHGANSAKSIIDAGSKTAAAQKTLASTHSFLNFRFYARLGALPSTLETIAFGGIRQSSDGTYQLGIYNNAGTYQMQMYNAHLGTSVKVNLPSGITAGTWHCYEQRIVRDPTAGKIEGYFDDVITVNQTGIDTGDSDFDSVRLGITNMANVACTNWFDCVVVDIVHIGLEGEESAPTYSNPTTSSTIAGQPCKFSVTLEDDSALATYIFGCNNTGSWINDTEVSISGLSYIANTTKTLNATFDVVVQWEYWFADANGNRANTGIQSLTTTPDYTSFNFIITGAPSQYNATNNNWPNQNSTNSNFASLMSTVLGWANVTSGKTLGFTGVFALDAQISVSKSGLIFNMSGATITNTATYAFYITAPIQMIGGHFIANQITGPRSIIVAGSSGQGCIFRGIDFDGLGLFLAWTNNVTVDTCEIHNIQAVGGNGYSMIITGQNVGNGNHTIIHSKFHDITGTSQLLAQEHGADNITIKDCEFYNAHNHAVYFDRIGGSNGYATIRDCRFHDSYLVTGAAVHLKTQNNSIFNNTFTDWPIAFSIYSDLLSYEANDNRIYNNTFTNCSDTNPSAPHAAIYVGHNTVNGPTLRNHFYDNIFIDTYYVFKFWSNNTEGYVDDTWIYASTFQNCTHPFSATSAPDSHPLQILDTRIYSCLFDATVPTADVDWLKSLFNTTIYGCAPWLADYPVSVPSNSTLMDVTLNSPADSSTSTSFTVSFVYTPTVRGDIFYSSELWLNLSGIYQIAAYNSSIIANYTTNTITYVFSSNNTYIWNIKIWNSTTGVFASSNRILTIGAYVALPRYYLNVVDKDLDLNIIDAYCTQQFLNGSTILAYAEGESSLLAGTITIKTYYLTMLVNSTDFDIPTYGDSTVIIYLNMKALSMGGFLAVNKTAAITFKNQTGTLINASITAAGTFQVACLVPANASLVQLDGVNVTDWVFNATNLSLRANLTSGDFSMTFAETLGEPWFGVTVGLVSLGSLGGAIWYYRRAAKKKSKVVPAS